MMKRVHCFLFFAALILALGFSTSPLLYAGTGSGKVTHLMAHSGEVVIFALETRLYIPACGAATGGQWALTLSTEEGKAMYSLLLAAALSGESVNVQGDAACNTPNMGNRESPNYIWIDF